jgi:glycosyltransferase involved in cell wall biosynthesis
MYRPRLRKVKLKRALDATLYRHVAANAALLIAVSRREREEYVAGGMPPAKIVVRPNGFPRAATTRVEDVRGRLRLPETAPLVLVVGRLAEGKGLELLVDAMPRLDPAHLVVAGPDDGHGVPSRLRARAEALGVARRVHLVGERPREEIDALHREAFAVALVSRADTFGMAAAEAASAGVPLVVTDRCGIAELLGGSALVVRYDSGEVGAALLELLTRPQLRVDLARAGREVARRHAWPLVVERQERIYRMAIARADPPLAELTPREDPVSRAAVERVGA